MLLVFPVSPASLPSAAMTAPERAPVLADSALDQCATLVTGGGTGLGKAAAKELAACSARVVVAGRREEVLAAAVEEIGAAASTCGRRARAGRRRAHAAARTIPLQRLGREQEHAWLVALAASPLGRALSGSVITLDGARDNWFGPWPPPSLLDEQGTVPTEERRPRP